MFPQNQRDDQNQKRNQHGEGEFEVELAFGAFKSYRDSVLGRVLLRRGVERAVERQHFTASEDFVAHGRAGGRDFQ